MKKILVTEDSQTILDMVKDILESEGYNVITAIDGQEAFSKAKLEKPDLIILDLMLPKLDGYKVCRMLKFDDNYKHIPIIIFTARASEADKKMGQDVSADAYITKPFQPEELLAKIKEFLKD
ncbi:MAG: response regulator [Candidatus Orphnella occulta]|nr:response regulator [Candidatus Orphnella occulta]